MTHCSFAVRQSGNIGQELIGPDGTVIAWTTDAWIAQAICKLLIDHEELISDMDKNLPAKSENSGGEYSI